MTAGEGSLCGLWVASTGAVHRSLAGPGGSRAVELATLRPFAWLGAQAAAAAAGPEIELSPLEGAGVFRHLAHADGFRAFDALLRRTRACGPVDVVRPYESQYLLQQRQRLYRDLPFPELRRCQVQLEFGDSGKARLIRLRLGADARELACLRSDDAGERDLLAFFNDSLAELDPDVIEGHGLFTGPLDQLRVRSQALKMPCQWGRFGQRAVFRSSRLKAAERWIDFSRCDAPGRAIVDTHLLVQIYDITARELSGYGQEAAAEYFGVTADDPLHESRALSDLLLPTYFEQTRVFPVLLQDATLRGQTSKIDLLFLEEYYQARESCPVPPEIAPFEGGYTKSFQEGVFRHVLHFDVASLYPSLLLAMNRNPASDRLGVFIPLLRSLRQYRMEYKQKARSAPTEGERAEAQARQTAFKILINSFYGYLGFAGARFGDGDLAAEVTRRGRELLQRLIEEFLRLGCTVLEADTDGIYLSSEKYAPQPEILLGLVGSILPTGIELEFDGRYEAMVCYKAKNYALFDGETVTLRGSAFRSRGMEPFLQRLTDQLLAFLVGLPSEPPLVRWENYRSRIARRELPVEELARSEILSLSPDGYEKWVAGGGKPRRAAAEAALQLTVRPRMGERVAYYLGPKAKGRTSDWQRARPVSRHDPVSAPYDPLHYLEKLDEWRVRYAMFLPALTSGPVETQGELL